MLQKPSRSLASEGRILLLSCYELGHVPLGVALPAAMLREAGFAPAVQDLATKRLRADLLEQAALVAISVPMHTALRLGVRIAAHIRAAHPHIHICFFGLYAGLHAEMLLDGPADSVIGGSFHAPLLGLAQALDTGAEPDLPGVSTPGRVRPVHLGRPPALRPERDGLPPLSTYAHMRHLGTDLVSGYTEATQGCKHQCLHCPITPEFRGRFFAIPVERVMEDIAALVEQGARHITFGDPDFLNGPTHTRRLVKAFAKAFPDISFDITAKVSHLIQHRELLPLLSDAGCLFIITAVELLNDRILDILRKGHTRDDIKRALHLTRQAGIAPRPTWMPFTPWSAPADFLDILGFVQGEGLIHHVDPVQYAIRMLVPARSALLASPHYAPHLAPFDRQALAHPWTHPLPVMDALQQQVAVLVEQDAAQEVDAESTFGKVLETALEAFAEVTLPPGEDWAAPCAPQPPAPRMTESWFC